MYGKVNDNRAKIPGGYCKTQSQAYRICIYEDWVSFWFAINRKISYKKFLEAEIKKYEDLWRKIKDEDNF